MFHNTARTVGIGLVAQILSLLCVQMACMSMFLSGEVVESQPVVRLCICAVLEGSVAIS